MEQILFIYTDQRLTGVVSALRQKIRDRITVVADFDEGLRLVFEKRPSIIFIQHEIAGVSCIAVVTHVKSLLREASPRMILLSPERSSNIVFGRDLFDGFIVISDDGRALHDTIVMELRASGRIIFAGEDQPEEPQPDSNEPESPIELSPLGEGETFTEPDDLSVPSPQEEPTGVLQFELLDELPPASSPPPFPETSQPEEIPPVVPLPADTLPQPPPPSLSDPFSERDREHPFFGINREDSTELPPYDQLFSLRKERSSVLSARRVISVALLLLVLAGGGYYLMLRGGDNPLTGSSVRSPQQRETAKHDRPSRRPVLLPSDLNDIPIDQKAMEQKPGWEIRRSSQFTVRIYREDGDVKALQVIGSTPGGLPVDLVAKLVDVAGGGFQVGSRRVLEGGVSLEEKHNGEGVEMAVYRRGDAPEPVALVFSFP